ncbi:hypothetical protein PoB_004415800 [Plakobranchus ocellatus]|uniref:Uncharacterized protein n=1 Tax=Plakobranchus ocellatus TaxID=259542 RepID=A0AAV4BFM7_9GAST|nr:hypothetical protein PoB_004415800 [Plakobranchus ocellatus]
MDSNGLQQAQVDTKGHRWTPVTTNGFKWTLMGTSRLMWTPMDTSGHKLQEIHVLNMTISPDNSSKLISNIAGYDKNKYMNRDASGL